MSQKTPAARRLFAYIALIVLGTIFSLPFFWLLTTSFKTDANISKWPPQIIPNPVTLEHYEQGMKTIPFGLYVLNTVVVCVGCVFGTLLSCSLTAYGLAKIRWRGRTMVFWVILSTMMLPYHVVMVPLFALFTKLGWVDTYLPLVVPAFFGNAFYIFLLRQFFMTIPDALIEAAKIDGCSELQIYWRIVLPLARPALATVGLFTFMATWNEFLMPLIYLFDEQRYTLSLGVQMFLGQYGNYFGRLMAIS
ncbi:MAG: carbohydrate ABC transporter permease, partial [Candidatus Sumerlaeota bacterium]|nr:carbohydrate ABC transporter permease [Candidatus Sumerlaeota bacterium]